MPGPFQAQLTNLHSCPLTVGVPAPVVPPCCVTVLVVKLPAARATDMCAGISPHPIAKGSMTVMIGKLPAARVGIDPCASGGPLVPMQFQVCTGG
jgi:uncharacterized Zn-binding protein involved in type VI secretion